MPPMYSKALKLSYLVENVVENDVTVYWLRLCCHGDDLFVQYQRSDSGVLHLRYDTQSNLV